MPEANRAETSKGQLMQRTVSGLEGTGPVVTLGESLGLVMGSPASPIRVGGQALFSFAGAESNVAIGLARLGHAVCFVSRVGDDIVGRAVVESMRGEGVDVDRVTVDTTVPTALMLRQHRTADVLTVDYYRTGCAGSALSVDDVPDELIRGARLLHVTGITPALSPSARAATVHAVDTAYEAGVPVSLDVNHRARLWSAEQAAQTLAPLLGHVELVFGGDDELTLLAPRAQRRRLRQRPSSPADRRPWCASAERRAPRHTGCSGTVTRPPCR